MAGSGTDEHRDRESCGNTGTDERDSPNMMHQQRPSPCSVTLHATFVFSDTYESGYEEFKDSSVLLAEYNTIYLPKASRTNSIFSLRVCGSYSFFSRPEETIPYALYTPNRMTGYIRINPFPKNPLFVHVANLHATSQSI